MIEFAHLSGRESDLVAVGGVAGGSRPDDLPLGQLARKRFGDRTGWIGRPGDPHRRIDVGSARQRIPDRAADAGGGAAEGLYLGRVVVRLVLEEEKPGLLLSVGLDGDLYGAGVDLLRFVELREKAFALQISHTGGGDVHEVDRLFVPAEAAPDGEIVFVCLLHPAVGTDDAVDRRKEGRMPAVIRPVGVDHPDLGQSRVSSLFLKITPAELKVVGVHSQSVVADESRDLSGRQFSEAVKHRHVGRPGVFCHEGGRKLQRGLS